MIHGMSIPSHIAQGSAKQFMIVRRQSVRKIVGKGIVIVVVAVTMAVVLLLFKARSTIQSIFGVIHTRFDCWEAALPFGMIVMSVFLVVFASDGWKWMMRRCWCGRGGQTSCRRRSHKLTAMFTSVVSNQRDQTMVPNGNLARCNKTYTLRSKTRNIF